MATKSRKRIQSDQKDFDALTKLVKPHEAKGRSLSVSLLLWFLETVYRLDEVEAADAVCDSPGDAGFDAIAVDDSREEIVVFQAKRREKLPGTLGDTDLKEFVGALAQIATQQAAKKLAANTTSADLERLLDELDVPAKLGAGYKVRAIFLTNVAADHTALNYAEQAAADGNVLDLWDLPRLSPVLKQLAKDWFVSESCHLQIDPSRLFIRGGTKREPELLYVAVRARQLVHLPGIDDSRVFAQNVRLGLGGTRVNDDLAISVRAKSEHKDFLAFHNGLTIVAKTFSVHGSKVKLKDFSVCNGCQSLLTFYAARAKLTDDLEVLVRIVRVGDDRRLPEVIAYRTNNQNPISLRDLSSNHSTQVRLKSEFDASFSDWAVYSIKRGDATGSTVLANEMAGRFLLALITKQPWAAHQKYKVFGELETQIFTYHTTAAQIRLSQLLMQRVRSKVIDLTNERMAGYGLTAFVVLYLLGEILRQSQDGVALLEDPTTFLSTKGVDNPKQAKVLIQVDQLLDWLMTELEYFVKEQGDENYDYKRELKSQKSVERIRDEMLKGFAKDTHKSRVTPYKKPK